MTNPSRYPAAVAWSEEDDGLIATATDLPGCSAFGPTAARAVAELRHAIAAWIAAAAAAGHPIPAPSRLVAEPLPSGKVLLRLPRDLHARLIDGAKRNDTSLNQYILYLLASAETGRTIDDAVTAAAAARIEPQPGRPRSGSKARKRRTARPVRDDAPRRSAAAGRISDA